MPDARRAALAALIDHAPLFPPASLPPAEAVAAHAAALGDERGWLVGRLAWPAATLDQLVALRPDGEAEPWTVTALLNEPAGAAALSAEGPLRFDQVEVRLVAEDDPGRLDEALSVAGLAATRVFEIALDPGWEKSLEVVAGAGAVAKIRTGGADPAAVPSPQALAAFVARCAEVGVAFKATAGLHHPFAHGAGADFQHGFAALIAAVAVVAAGLGTNVAAAALTDGASAFGLTDDGFRWRDLWVDADQLRSLRASGFRGFGSCSFDEPAADLEELGWLS